jgi:uncharacterized protein (DUF2147 family)
VSDEPRSRIAGLGASLCGALALLALACGARAAGIEGRWTTFDDDTGKPRSTIEVTASGSAFTGRIVALVPAPGEPPAPRCTACRGARADAPIIGMTILEVTPREGEPGRYGGIAFDPEEGREYRCIVTLAPDGDALVLRGYVAIPILGREVTWRRAP